MSSSYILITPAKNEEASIKGLIDSIIAQTIRPKLWAIVDDGSNDITPEIIRTFSSQYKWIHLLSLETAEAYNLEEHYSEVCIEGFNYAFEFSRQEGISYDFIGLSDADMKYPPVYFEKLMEEMSKHPRCGILSGRIEILNEDGTVKSERFTKLSEKLPRGSGRLWRKEAFEETGGYLVVKSPDAVSNTLAVIKGWNIGQIESIVCYETRETGSKKGLWKGFFNRGRRFRYLGFTLPSFIFQATSLLFYSGDRSFTKSMAFGLGYLQSFLRREEKVPVEAVRRYNSDYRRILGSLKKVLT